MKTDLFVGSDDSDRFIPTTIKSNRTLLEGGAGLRVAAVPRAHNLKPGVHRVNTCRWRCCQDPSGFMGLYNDGYRAVGRTIDKLGRHTRERYFE